MRFTLSVTILKYLTLLLIISFPVKSFSLLFLILFDFVVLFEILTGKVRVNKVSARYIFLLFIFQCFLVSIYYSPIFIFNVILFFVFISPVIWFIIVNNENTTNKLTDIQLKKIIEIYLRIQIFFSFINALYRVVTRGLSFDTDFGDIIAGTFRMPFTYKADVSNPIFALTITLVLFLYIVRYKEKANKSLIITSFIIVFFASVNHLILALIAAAAIIYLKRFFLRFLFGLIVVLFLYSYFQPGNYSMIVKRMEKVSHVLLDINTLNSIGFKGRYLYHFINDFSDHKFVFVFTGVGAGTYSSRAAMFFSGDYIQSFPVKNMTNFMQNNTYYLWKKFLDSPSWMQGSFNYPFNSIISFLAELGLLNLLIIGVLFWKRLKEIDLYTFRQRMFLIIFLLFLGLVDNYYEYYQVFFVFYLLNVLNIHTLHSQE